MSHIIAPEITIESTPLLLELCSDDFEMDNIKATINDLDTAAASIKEACELTSKAINNAKTNLLKVYMSDPKCRRWLKKEFQEKVDCDSGLLSKVARECGFKFYTNEKLVIEDLDNNGEDTPSDEVTQRTGVPEKTVERIKNKIQKKREEAFIEEQRELEENLNSDHNQERIEQLEVAMTSTPKAIMDDNTSQIEEDADSQEEISVQPIADNKPDTNEPEVAMTTALPSIDQVEVLTEKVKNEVEVNYKQQIEELKNTISEKDAEIARLKALLAEKN